MKHFLFGNHYSLFDFIVVGTVLAVLEYLV